MLPGSKGSHGQGQQPPKTTPNKPKRSVKPRPLRVFTKSRLGTIRIPRSLRTVLLDFTMTFLFESPRDVIKFGYDYFKTARDRKKLLKKHGRIFDEDFSESTSDDSMECNKGDRFYCYKCGKEVKKCVQCEKIHRVCYECATVSKSPFCALVEPAPVKAAYDVGDSPIVPHRKQRRDCIYAEGMRAEEAHAWNPPIHPKTDEQSKRISAYLSGKTLFKELEADELETIVNAMFLRDVEMNEVVIRQGRGADFFYVVDMGTYRAYVKDEEGDSKILASYEGQGSFGELALLYNVPRCCNVKALTAGRLWVLDRDTFRKIVIKGAMRKRENHLALLRSVPMLQVLSMFEMLNIADCLEIRRYGAGEKIIEQGEQATGMFFVDQGKVSVSFTDEYGVDVVLDTLEGGAYFGEVALIEKQARKATVTAMTDVTVAFLQRDAFERLLGPCQEIMNRKLGEYETQREEKLQMAQQDRDLDLD